MLVSLRRQKSSLDLLSLLCIITTFLPYTNHHHTSITTTAFQLHHHHNNNMSPLKKGIFSSPASASSPLSSPGSTTSSTKSKQSSSSSPLFSRFSRTFSSSTKRKAKRGATPDMDVEVDVDEDLASVSSSSIAASSSPLPSPSIYDRQPEEEEQTHTHKKTHHQQQQHAKQKKDLVTTFEARPFEPLPWVTNEHWQTIWGARAVQDLVLQAVAPSKLPQGWQDVYDRREKWTTPDGDFFHVDFMYCDQRPLSPSDAPRPVAIVLHGLESTSSALLPRSMAKAYAKRGFDVLALNFRGCCGNDNVKPYSYHLGFTDDLAYVIRRLHSEDSRRRIYLTGFSLGGNVILKCLGELGEEAVALGVAGAAVACVPFDAVRSSSKIDSGFNRYVYAANFLSTLKVKAQKKWEKHADENLYDLERVLACKCIGDFDDEVIAKLHNFEGKVDYYTQSCSKQYLPRIRVPSLVVNAIDDPFINEKGLPTQEEVGEAAPVRLVYHKNGGHCGFLTGREEKGMAEEERFLPVELARFLEHVDVKVRTEEGERGAGLVGEDWNESGLSAV